MSSERRTFTLLAARETVLPIVRGDADDDLLKAISSIFDELDEHGKKLLFEALAVEAVGRARP